MDPRRIVSGFTGAAGSSFAVGGRHLDRDGALIGTGLGLFEGRSTVSLDYVAEVRGDCSAHGTFARFGFAF